MRLGAINSKVISGIAVIAIIFILPLTCPNTQAQTNTAFDPTTKFSVPAYNATINFALNGTYSNATFQNNVWEFTNLRLEYSWSLQNFSVSAQNCNVTIFSYQMLDPSTQTSFLTYTVEGKGKQTLNMGYGPQVIEPASVEWSVLLPNNVFASQGQEWNISPDGTLSINGANGNITVIHSLISSAGQNSNLPFYEQHSVAIIVAVAVAATVSIAIVIKLNSRRNKR